MNFLRTIFFGLIQVIELPINAMIELWRIPGRGRGLLLGLPSIFVLLATLLTIGWAKYGSNKSLIEDYSLVCKNDRKEIDKLTDLIGDSKLRRSNLGDSSDVTPNSADASVPSAPLGILGAVISQIQREIAIPSLNDVSTNPRVVVRAELGAEGSVAKAEIVKSSGSSDWDRAVLVAVRETPAFGLVANRTELPSKVDLDFGFNESRREKLRYKLSINLKKLIDLDVGNAQHKYDFGILSAEMGLMTQAKLIMDQIASPDRPGMCQAHLWQAHDIWNDKQSKLDFDTRRRLCLAHLTMALRADPTNLEVNEGLGELNYSIGNFAEAEKYYRTVWEKQLSTTLRLFSIYLQQKDVAKADALLSSSKERLKQSLAADPKNRVLIFDLERICLLQGNIAEAIEVLQTHAIPEIQDEVNRRLSRIYSGWAKVDAGKKGGVFGLQEFEKLKTSFQFDPNNPDALWLLTVVGTQGADFAQEAVALYDPVKNRESAPAEVLREYASHLLRLNKPTEAIVWLEQAYQRSPNDPVAANNLAYLLLTTAPTNPDRALELINRAIVNAENQSLVKLRGSLFDTKGAALIALKRHAEAITFLELALRDRGPDRRILTALRDCYLATAQADVAKTYQDELDRLDAAQSPPQ